MRAWVVLLLVPLAGCLNDAPGADDPPVPGAGAPRVSAVVADLGPGANVYHERWQRPDWTEHPADVIAGFPRDAVALNLTFGPDYEANLAADKAIWDSIEEGVLYWIPGTNLLGYVHRPYSSTPPGHAGAAGFHGAGTTDAINQACPDCYVLFIQDSGSMDGASVRLMAEWTWVDVVTSTNTPGPVCYWCAFPFVGGSPAYAEATKALHDRGGLFVAATGNFPINGIVNVAAPFPWYDYCCTPWVVNVGGGQHECKAAISLAGRVPEMVGDFTQQLTAVAAVNETVYMSGTSFATPQVAGRFGAVLVALRAELGDTRDGAWWDGPAGAGLADDGRITQEEVRLVLGRLGEHWTTADYDPAAPECGSSVFVGPVTQQVPAVYNVPVGPVPAVDLGWGYLANVTEAAVDVLLGRADLPVRDGTTNDVMAAQMDARRALYP